MPPNHRPCVATPHSLPLLLRLSAPSPPQKASENTHFNPGLGVKSFQALKALSASAARPKGPRGVKGGSGGGGGAKDAPGGDASVQMRAADMTATPFSVMVRGRGCLVGSLKHGICGAAAAEIARGLVLLGAAGCSKTCMWDWVGCFGMGGNLTMPRMEEWRGLGVKARVY